MARKYNALTNKEIYKLTTVVKEYDAWEVFDTWEEITEAFAEYMQRKITKPNIESAAKNCGLNLNNVLSLAQGNHPVAHMMAKVKELEKIVNEHTERLSELEQDLTSITLRMAVQYEQTQVFKNH